MDKCNKCDETGHIADIDTPGHYSSHSCPCGKYNQIMKEKFANVSIEDLLTYGRNRVIEKQKLCQTD